MCPLISVAHLTVSRAKKDYEIEFCAVHFLRLGKQTQVEWYHGRSAHCAMHNHAERRIQSWYVESSSIQSPQRIGRIACTDTQASKDRWSYFYDSGQK